jgi:hypothetical protein
VRCQTPIGKKTSRQKDVLSYFQKPQFKDPHSLHASSYFEQPIIERDINSYENASNIHIIDEIIISFGDQGEINAFSLEIGNKNVEGFSLEEDTIHSQKRKRVQWDIRRNFQPEWVSKFPFIEPIPPKNKNDSS